MHFTAVLPADHRIAPLKRFQEDLRDCLDAASDDKLVTLGVTPDKPATGYGYIKAGEKTAPGFYKVDEFKEKPDFETAQQYMVSGSYWWNCGIFVWKISAIVQAFRQYHPMLYTKIQQWSDGKDYNTDFAECEKISIDYAIIEKADNVLVKQASFQWSDLGILQSLYELSLKDFYENAVNASGKVQLENCRGNLIYSDDDTEIRLEKMENCAVIKSGKALWIKPIS